MIKKCFGWFDIYYAEMLLGVTFAIFNACAGNSSVALAWFAFAFSWGIFKLIISVENRRHKALIFLSGEMQGIEKRAVKKMVWFCHELYLEKQRHTLTALQGMKYKE